MLNFNYNDTKLSQFGFKIAQCPICIDFNFINFILIFDLEFQHGFYYIMPYLAHQYIKYITKSAWIDLHNFPRFPIAFETLFFPLDDIAAVADVQMPTRTVYHVTQHGMTDRTVEIFDLYFIDCGHSGAWDQKEWGIGMQFGLYVGFVEEVEGYCDNQVQRV